MIPNRLKPLWSEGKPTVDGWCSIRNPFVAEIMAAQGFDSITIDMQLGALDYSQGAGAAVAGFRKLTASAGTPGEKGAY